jgi:hypothetical protein
MIRRIALAATVLAGAFLAGCASGPKFSEVSSSIPSIPAAEGRIYFFRSSSMMGAALQPDVRLNGEVVGTSKPGGFFYVDRPAGSYTAAASTDKDKAATFTLAVGETKYLRTSPTFGVLVGGIAVELADPQKAQAEIQTLSLTGSLMTGSSVAPPAPVAAPAPAPAPAANDPGATASDRPARTRHLDAALLEGQTWTYPHPRDPARFGQVRIRFANGVATANNAKSSSSGPYRVTDDMVCIDFQSHDWTRACFYAFDSDPAATGGVSRPMLWTVSTRVAVPLTIN